MTGPEHWIVPGNLPLRRTGCSARETARPLRASGPPVVQAHAVLALAGVTAIGASGADHCAWANVAGTGFGFRPR
jgi:hypothetical protein